MRRFPWRAAVAVVAAVPAVVWVLDPPPAEPPVTFLRPSATPAAAPPPAALSRYASPVRYAYQPACQDESGPCTHWNLVTAGGEHGWLPGADAGGDLSLSGDGTRAVYLRDDTYVVADLTTGTLKPLPVRHKGDPAGEPLFSLDGRHLLIQFDHLDEDDEVVPDDRLIVDIDRGAVHRLATAGEVAGWTSDGLVTVSTRRTDSLPGHVTSASFTVHSPRGETVRTFTLPGNLGAGVPSPSGRTLAALAQEITPEDVAHLGVNLVGASAGRLARTVVPRLPPGRHLTEIIRWDGEDGLVVRTRGPAGEIALHVLDLATGGTRPLGVEMADVTDPFRAPAGLSVVVGSVR
ncbi:hypothetical protein [Nonomuraea sp. NPDC002799]